METAEIHKSFAEIVSNSLAIDQASVQPEATLEKLGAASLDVVEISMEAESRFNVWLPDKSILDTAIEMVGRPQMLDGDRLTEFGKAMFRARLPQEQWSLLDGEVTSGDLRSYFMRVDTWVRMIADLREQTPKACTACGGRELADRPGFTLVCESCGEEMKLRPGQEINREWIEGFIAKSGSNGANQDVDVARSVSAAG